jgi:hypothetical protein
LCLFWEEALKYGKFVSAMYIISVVIQGFFSLACLMALGALFAWVFVSRAGAPTVLYPIFIVLGALIGFYSMIRFILNTMQAVERLEKEREDRLRAQKSIKRTEDKADNEK